MSLLTTTALQADGTILATWADGQSATYGAYWLRDNCRCPQCRHPGNGQKLYQIVDLPAQLSVQTLSLVPGPALEVVWSDGHGSAYGGDWLAAHQLGSASRHARQVKPLLWDQRIAASMPLASWPALLADPAQELAWLERYTALGFGLLKDVPTTPGAVAEVGDRLGFVRITNYGRLFDVKSVPNPTNLAYTAVALGVHSDNPYRHPSPGVQLLHCLEAEAPGGNTLLVDGFAAAELLRQQDPAAFELLRTVPMNFRYADAQTDLRARQTLISTEADGLLKAVHFNNRSADWLDAPADVAEAWYQAYRQFAQLLLRDELQLVFRLAPGDCVVMQNDRTLHGRTAFDPNLGRRHLQGCYIDRDAMESRRLVLSRPRHLAKNTHDTHRKRLAMTAMNEIRAAFERRGHETYGEGVSQLDHALQCAAFAERDGADAALVTATLLHDIGHLLHDLPADVADSGIDTQHEASGSAWLSRHFGLAVTEPVRMHVAAKRYLATMEPGYFERLSEASVLSLRLQGGSMSAPQAAAFAAEPFFADAIRLRRWDEEGKIVGYHGPALDHFLPRVQACLA